MVRMKKFLWEIALIIGVIPMLILFCIGCIVSVLVIGFMGGYDFTIMMAEKRGH